MEFKTIDLEMDKETALHFRRESFRESFGDEDSLDEGDYLDWLQKKINEYPSGVVFVMNGEETIGQIELSIRAHQGRIIGYVHLFYLKEEWRGEGYWLFDYAMKFFHVRDITEFHLRVAPENKRAVAFYKKYGMTEAGEELGGKVIRMIGSVNAWTL
ncbi:GNAT family N-acetyltransferase [Salimicrobium sp. PL1-032A]|uniref:GNAT family N-acetyltransferase n=1 Tax=Salimicrobium sp. PL1-032A TaxID=3095364 RepID=UPI003260B9DF